MLVTRSTPFAGVCDGHFSQLVGLFSHLVGLFPRLVGLFLRYVKIFPPLLSFAGKPLCRNRFFERALPYVEKALPNVEGALPIEPYQSPTKRGQSPTKEKPFAGDDVSKEPNQTWKEPYQSIHGWSGEGLQHLLGATKRAFSAS